MTNPNTEYRNKESSQTTLETDEARSKDLKMQVTENNEISSIEKSNTNLDLARDQQIKEITLFAVLELDLGLWLIFLYYLIQTL